jgi:hypothetical protein
MPSSGLSEYAQDVEGQSNMPLAIEKLLVPATRYPAQPEADQEADRKLNISLVFTSVESTLASLKEAGASPSRLGARITRVAPQVVPFPLALESPPALVEFNARRFREIANYSPVDIKVHIYLGRDALLTLTPLKPGSLVVLGGRKRWWPTREKKLARQLRRAGHEVVFKETE